MPFQLPESIALDLLQKLAHDDAFRASFANDPAAVLESMGVQGASVMPAEVFQQLRTQALASKQALAASHRALSLMHIEAMAPFIPITLELQPATRAA